MTGLRSLVVALLLMVPASARAERRLQVLVPDGSAAAATVEVWPAKPATSYCQGSLRACLCPGKAEATVEALQRAPAAAPLAKATADATGQVTIAAEIPSDAWLLARSARGDAGALVLAADAAASIKLSALVPMRFKLGSDHGLDVASARAFSIDPGSGAVEQLAAQPDGTWVGKTLAPGHRTLVVLVPGAVPFVNTVPHGTEVSTFGARPAGGIATLKLVPYRPVEGVVLENGKPAAGAEVVLDPDGCQFNQRADAAGKFRFEYGPAGDWSWNVNASRKGRLAWGNVREGKIARLVLEQAATVEATVAYLDGKPADALELSAGWLSPLGFFGRSLQGTTDRAGRVRWSFPGAGRVTVSGHGRGFVVKGQPGLDVRRGEVAKLKVELEQTSTLEVEVLDESGKPARGVTIQADWGTEPNRGTQREWPSGYGKTDAWGTVQMNWLAPGKHYVSATDPERGAVAGTVTVPGKLKLQFGGVPVLTVAVVDEGKKPVPGIEIGISRPAEGSINGRTDEKGQVRRALKEGEWVVNARLPRLGGELARQTVVLPASGAVQRTLEVKVPPPAKITVLDPAKKPIAGASLTFRTQPPIDLALKAQRPELVAMELSAARPWGAFGQETPTTAADGTITMLVQGPLWVSAVAEGYRESEPVPVTNGAAQVVLQRCPVAVGRVVDSRGAPIKGVTVSNTLTDAEGRFRISLRDVKRTTLYVRGRGFLSTQTEVSPPPDPVDVAVPDIALRDAATLQVRVLEKGTAVPSVKVRLEPAQRADAGAPNPYPRNTDDLGRAAFEDIEPGAYLVHLEQSGGPRGKPRAVKLAPGEEAALDVTLR